MSQGPRHEQESAIHLRLAMRGHQETSDQCVARRLIIPVQFYLQQGLLEGAACQADKLVPMLSDSHFPRIITLYSLSLNNCIILPFLKQLHYTPFLKTIASYSPLLRQLYVSDFSPIYACQITIFLPTTEVQYHFILHIYITQDGPLRSDQPPSYPPRCCQKRSPLSPCTTNSYARGSVL